MTTTTMPTAPVTAAPARAGTGLRDARTMVRRSIRRMIRYPSLTIMLVGLPVMFLLLFVYVFGGAIGGGIDGGGRAAYASYLAPGILVMTVASAVQGTAISIAMDMTEGIIARFRTMAISQTAVLTGHVIATVLQVLVGTVIVLGVALLVGFRPGASAVEWVAALGLVIGFAVALIWLAVALGLQAKSVETASNTPMFLTLLPFLGSGFVPTESMPAGLRWFAEYQPFTSVIETLRGLLLGTEIGTHAWLALGWTLVIGVASFLWARSLFSRPRLR